MWIFVCHLPIAGIIDDSDASQGVAELTGAMEELEEPEELEDMEQVRSAPQRICEQRLHRPFIHCKEIEFNYLQ